MNQCDKCGTDNTENARYCLNCGYELHRKITLENQEEQSIPKEQKGNKRQVTTVLGAIVGILFMFGIQQFFFKPQTAKLDKLMMQFASEINKSCPIMIDSETRLDNAIALPNNVFLYNYSLVNIEKGKVDTMQIKNLLVPKIINFVKSSPQMKPIRDAKVTIDYYYKDKNGVYLFQVPITSQQYE
ncbi:MAG: zinc-ribbon domain-containing protein [Paludibacter sp.]|nr:zinc-ribbon domain-containing protein [Paludibacter sp.]